MYIDLDTIGFLEWHWTKNGINDIYSVALNAVGGHAPIKDYIKKLDLFMASYGIKEIPTVFINNFDYIENQLEIEQDDNYETFIKKQPIDWDVELN